MLLLLFIFSAGTLIGINPLSIFCAPCPGVCVAPIPVLLAVSLVIFCVTAHFPSVKKIPAHYAERAGENLTACMPCNNYILWACDKNLSANNFSVAVNLYCFAHPLTICPAVIATPSLTPYALPPDKRTGNPYDDDGCLVVNTPITLSPITSLPFASSPITTLFFTSHILPSCTRCLPCGQDLSYIISIADVITYVKIYFLTFFPLHNLGGNL